MIGVAGNAADRNVRRSADAGLLDRSVATAGQRRDRLMLEHRARRDAQARPAAPGSPAGST